ncbi:MAG: fluoride efflux transporter CrcB [Gammaproteobacteria bacterium]|nr:MAG: fluoride efflux transporter CrcB [Gammaproteobacteria bacterium]
MQWLAIAIGGALGSMLRFASVSYLTPLFNFKFPIGTFIVNIIGSLLIGVLYVLLVEKNNLSPLYRLFFITGLLGGYTTFSAFSLEMLQLWQSGHVVNSMAYAIGSVILGLLAAFFGMWITQKAF